MIAIVDYGSGNLASMAGAVRKLGYETEVTADASALERADKLILPGVGAFGDGMANLEERGLIGTLTEMAMKRGKPILGVCAGAQLMCESSDEFGEHRGLGWIPARVTRLRPSDPALAVPHVGWDDLERTRDCVLFDGIETGALFYYVHSYAIRAEGPIEAGRCDYGGAFTAVFQRGNVFGVQFHPEKSQRHGLALLGNFLAKA
jgi:glutamine amidotransferase